MYIISNYFFAISLFSLNLILDGFLFKTMASYERKSTNISKDFIISKVPRPGTVRSQPLAQAKVIPKYVFECK